MTVFVIAGFTGPGEPIGLPGLAVAGGM